MNKFRFCLGLLIWLALPAYAASGLSLETAPPPEFGKLDLCAQATEWKVHPEVICLRVSGRGGCSSPATRLATEQCFRIKQGSEVLVQGAVIPPQSARLLRIPVLVTRLEADQPIAELLSDWPAVQAAMPPWLPKLAKLTAGKDFLLRPVDLRAAP